MRAEMFGHYEESLRSLAEGEIVRGIVLAVDAIVLGLLVPRITVWMESEARPEQSGLVARRWPLVSINITLLAISFFVIDFFDFS